jgi:hypothetical protein
MLTALLVRNITWLALSLPSRMNRKDCDAKPNACGQYNNNCFADYRGGISFSLRVFEFSMLEIYRFSVDILVQQFGVH